jgi:hypothetical protein
MLIGGNIDLKAIRAWETGGAVFVGLFAPVNESVWEHLKMGFWPLVAYSCVEWMVLREKSRGFPMAKLLGILAMEFFIVGIFYGYTAIIGREFLPVDIGTFVAGTALCQFVSVCFLERVRAGGRFSLAGAAGILGIAVLFMLFTYVTPRTGIFRDSNTGEYGTRWGATPSESSR